MPFLTWNGAAPTSAALAKVTTGTSIKTMLQLATPSTEQMQILAWGFSLDAAPGGASVVELLQTDTAATVTTAHVSSGVVNLDPNGPATRLTLGVTATGYTSLAENAPAATRLFDTKEIPAAAGATDLTYEKVFLPYAQPIVAVSKFLRVRVTVATSAVNMVCWVLHNPI